MTLKQTPYYQEALRYLKMAETQQRECNLGIMPHANGSVKDPLMQNVKLYDVANRKYAGFSQLVHDMFYGYSRKHPYYGQMNDTRLPIAKSFTGWRKRVDRNEVWYAMLIHRLTGSAINYSKFPSGYHNSTMPDFSKAHNMSEMGEAFMDHVGPKYTSIGYQIAAFPKPVGSYVRGGDYFIVELLPTLVRDLSYWFNVSKGKRDLREVGEFMFAWNQARGIRRYKFQYAAFIADLADWYPELVNTHSLFYYGTNAVESFKLLFDSPLKGDKFLDEVMIHLTEKTGYAPYDLEDSIGCDFIRWVENYIRPGATYDHLDRDKIWSSCKIKNHPFGRQKKMLDSGLIKSFNDLTVHPSDDYIISRAGLTVEQYKSLK